MAGGDSESISVKQESVESVKQGQRARTPTADIDRLHLILLP